MKFRLGGPLTLQRKAVYALSFLLPPILFGTFMSLAVIKDVVFLRQPEEVPASLLTGVTNRWDPAKKNVLILAGKGGAQITDLFASYEVFARAERWNVRVVSLTDQPIPTTGAISVLPHHTMDEELKAEVIVVPSILDYQNPIYSDWVKDHAYDAKVIVGLSEGARILAGAGLLDGQTATSHFVGLEDMRTNFPQTEFRDNVAFVESGKVVTSRGITASVDTALYVVEKLLGRLSAEKIATEMGWKEIRRSLRASAIEPGDIAQLFLRGAYDWSRKGNGVWVQPGISESSLAFVLDTLPRSLTHQTVSFSHRREPVQTQHGLWVVSSVSFEETPLLHRIWILPRQQSDRGTVTKRGSDELFTVSASTDRHPLANQAFADGAMIEDLSTEPKPASVLFRIFAMFELEEGKAIASFIAKMVEYPDLKWSANSSSFPTRIWLRPIVIAFLGLFFCWRIDLALYGRRARIMLKRR